MSEKTAGLQDLLTCSNVSDSQARMRPPHQALAACAAPVIHLSTSGSLIRR